MTISSLSRKPAQFIGTVWGVIRTFSIAARVFLDDELIISPAALRVLMVLMERVKTSNRYRRDPEGLAKVRVGHALLTKRTGLSTNTVTRALKELEAVGFVEADKGHEERGRYRRKGRFTITKYYPCIPKWDANTGRMVREGLIYRKGQSLFHKTGIGYFSVPSSIVRESDARWSLATMSNSEVALYCSLLEEARRQRSPQFHFDKIVLRNKSALSRPSFTKALHILQSKSLIRLQKEGGEIVLCDPMTGEPVHQETGDAEANPGHYFIDEGKRKRRVNLNCTPEQLEAFIISSLPPGFQHNKQPNNGNLRITCPFHEDTNPSCSVYLETRGFNCFGCDKRGTVRELLKELRGENDRQVIESMAQATGQTATFRDPDVKFETVYDYRDADGNLLYQKTRTPDKQFGFRRPDRGGMAPNVRRVKRVIYNLQAVKDAGTVFWTESEKDADAVNRLGLVDRYGLKIVASTSGGAKSWEDHHADPLRGKQIIFGPHNDEAGYEYVDTIIVSLDARGIEHYSMSFEGTGCKDVAEFLENHSPEELVQLIGIEWVRLPMPEPNTREEVLEPASPQIIVQQVPGGQMQAVFDH